MEGQTPEKSKPKVFPLSPTSQLETGEIYNGYLREAFHNKQIRNIAVTGDFGIGKSSVIRTFEQMYLQELESAPKGRVRQKVRSLRRKLQSHNKPGFLYVSLGDFSGQQLPPEQENSLEHRLLLQVYSRFHKRDLPFGSFLTIREKPRFLGLITILLALLVLSALLLAFHEQAGAFLQEFAGREGPFQTVWNFLWKRKTGLHAALYAYTILGTALAAGAAAYCLLSRYRVDNLAVKSEHAEMAMKKAEDSTYLDRHCRELVYTLEQVADQIGGTVVFEDIDRLGENICIPIFTKLREINQLVNSRLEHEGKKRGETYIRFLYVTNDRMTGYMERVKFFDYILPVVPTLSRRNACEKFYDLLGQVNEGLGDDFPKGEYPEDFDDIAAYITDYRMLFTILNEYGVFCRAYRDGNSVMWEDAVSLLALVIYKNFFPKDYSQIRQGKSRMVSGPPIEEESIEDDMLTLFRVLEEHVGTHSLRYLGYSDAETAGFREAALKSAVSLKGKQKIINHVSSNDKKSIEMLKKQAESGDLTAELSEGEQKDMLLFLLHHFVWLRETDYRWFFQSGEFWDRLQLLEKLDAEDMRHLFELRGSNASNQFRQAFSKVDIVGSNTQWTQWRLVVVYTAMGGRCDIKRHKNAGIDIEGEHKTLSQWFESWRNE